MLFLDTLTRENKRNINISKARYVCVPHILYIGVDPKPLKIERKDFFE